MQPLLLPRVPRATSRHIFNLGVGWDDLVRRFMERQDVVGRSLGRLRLGRSNVVGPHVERERLVGSYVERSNVVGPHMERERLVRR